MLWNGTQALHKLTATPLISVDRRKWVPLVVEFPKNSFSHTGSNGNFFSNCIDPDIHSYSMILLKTTHYSKAINPLGIFGHASRESREVVQVHENPVCFSQNLLKIYQRRISSL